MGTEISVASGRCRVFLGGNEGLGYLVVASMNQLNQPRVFAVVVLFAILGSVLLFAVNVAKRLTIPWHESAARKSA